MEEKKKLNDILDLCNEHIVDDILELIENEKPQPIEMAEMVADAYKLGTDLFWRSYQNEMETSEKLRVEIGKIKERLYEDFLKGC